VASAVAIFKYRLYDLDIVIRKTLVFGVIAAFITAVYMALVVGPVLLVGDRGDNTALVLSALAAGVVAVAFQPIRQRAQRLANRLVSRSSRGVAEEGPTDALGGGLARGQRLPEHRGDRGRGRRRPHARGRNRQSRPASRVGWPVELEESWHARGVRP
jgi:hypothetical protein